jgi:hypothetical protein
MNQNLIPTRVLETEHGCFVVQFKGGLNGWTTFSDTFATFDQAQEWEDKQIASADFGEEK